MKTRKEFRKVRQIIHTFESFQYPGYPYSHFGVVDFKTKDCWDSNGRKKFIVDDNWYKFAAKFEAGMLYHILDSDFYRKGSSLKQDKTYFCSRSCSSKSRRVYPMEVRACLECGEEFTVISKSKKDVAVVIVLLKLGQKNTFKKS